jgi:hypothetical protein
MNSFLKFLILNWRVIAVVGGFVLAIFAVAQIWSCAVDSLAKRKINKIERKINESQRNVTIGETLANIQSNKVKETLQNANNANALSNRALSDAGNISRRDSGEFTNNYNNAKRLFCEQFPNDSACRKR